MFSSLYSVMLYQNASFARMSVIPEEVAAFVSCGALRIGDASIAEVSHFASITVEPAILAYRATEHHHPQDESQARAVTTLSSTNPSIVGLPQPQNA